MNGTVNYLIVDAVHAAPEDFITRRQYMEILRQEQWASQRARQAHEEDAQAWGCENLRLEKKCYVQWWAIEALAVIVIALLIYTFGVK